MAAPLFVSRLHERRNGSFSAVEVAFRSPREKEVTFSPVFANLSFVSSGVEANAAANSGAIHQGFVHRRESQRSNYTVSEPYSLAENASIERLYLRAPRKENACIALVYVVSCPVTGRVTACQISNENLHKISIIPFGSVHAAVRRSHSAIVGSRDLLGCGPPPKIDAT